MNLLLPSFVSFLRDNEAEVRTAAAAKLAGCTSHPNVFCFNVIDIRRLLCADRIP